MPRRAVGQAIACTFVVSILSGAVCTTAVAKDGRPARTHAATGQGSQIAPLATEATPEVGTAQPSAARQADVGQAERLESADPDLRFALAGLAAERSPSRLLTVAEAYAAAGVFDTAYDRASEAISLDPTNARAYDLRARLWRRWGMPERGLGDAHRAAYFAPWSPEAQAALGTTLEALCQPGAARAAYERALALDPSAAYARANLARMDGPRGDAGNRCAPGTGRGAVDLGPGGRR